MLPISRIVGTLSLAGLIASSYFLFGKSCSLKRSNYFYKSSLNVAESVLDCKDQNRDYSVFLVSKEELSGDTSKPSDVLSFKVVDNKDNKKIKWGPDSKKEEGWTDWGIAIYTEDIPTISSSGRSTVVVKNYTTIIRVPKTGNIYDKDKHWTSLKITCQKSNLKLKKEIIEGSEQQWGRILRSENMKFEVTPEGDVKIAKNFDFKDNFRPKLTWCSS